MRQFIPASARRQVKQALRYLNDKRLGYNARFASPGNGNPAFPFSIPLRQPILSTATVSNKIHNLNLAVERINRVVVGPGEIFSFWHILGAPSGKKGYRRGRNLIAGRLQEDYGGGLCQLSGIVYHVSLLGTMEIVERHNHSVDIYTPETRFAPLGSDATVVYGYKDLRVANPYPFAVRFFLTVEPEGLHIELQSQERITEEQIRFQVSPFPEFVEVRANNARNEPVACSRYRIGQ